MPYLGNYGENLLEQILFQQRYPNGEYEYINGVKTPIDPVYQTQQDERGARAAASLGEDIGLRYALGRSSRDRNMEPVGHYSSTDYAGGPSPWMTARGVERGYRYTMPGQVMSNEEKMALKEHGKDWYEQQMKLWGRGSLTSPKTYEELRTMNRAGLNRRAW